MIAGLPGTGIGGLYYLLIALWMPLHGLIHNLDNRLPSFKRGIIRRQVFLTVMVLVGMWITGWLLGVCLAILIPSMASATRTSLGSLSIAENVIQITPFILTLVTLTLVYCGMQGIRFIIHRRNRNGMNRATTPVTTESG